MLSLGSVNDVGQLRAGFQSSDRLDSTAGEVGENRCPEQVILSFSLSLTLFHSPIFQLLPEVKLEVPGVWSLALSHKQNGSIALALIQRDP